MESHQLVELLLFCSVFLIATASILAISKKFKFPYTALLLIAGFIAQYGMQYFGLSAEIGISTDLIYFLLLPLLLFESAVHINFHQFKLQFKTITFLSTFGLLVSIGSVTILVSTLAGLPWEVALLFGALISATDPIAVLAIFKNLGAPKRLALIADGESMFNDATGVIAYRVVSASVLGGTALGVGDTLQGAGSFVVVFIGSIGLGTLCAYLMSIFIAKVDNDRLVETTMTIALAIGSFILAEHFFHLSGVITTVVAGIAMGNLGKTRISVGVKDFLEELWEYTGFIALSIVFFFSTFTLQLGSIFQNIGVVGVVIFSVVIARAISVYVSCYITNHSRFFSDEPNIPLAWQHVLNWGGLRGVIPLVLVYSIPDSFMYKDLLLQCTLATFLFTLFINATTIDRLLIALKLHLPKREEEIVHIEEEIFAVEEAKKNIGQLSESDFNHSIVREVEEKIRESEKKLRTHLLEIATPQDFERSMRLQSIQIERQVVEDLYRKNHIDERVFFEFEGELDLQQDALEHPDILRGSRAMRKDGTIDSSSSFQLRLERAKEIIQKFPLLKSLSWNPKEELLIGRLSLLQARITASGAVIAYLEKVEPLLGVQSHYQSMISTIHSEHERHRLRNLYQMQEIERDYPRIYKQFEYPLVQSYAWAK